MGKVIRDGFHFMEYVNARLIRNIDDIAELKDALITLSETKTHIELSKYALLLADHLLCFSNTERSAAIEACFAVNKQWQRKEIRFQDALEAAGVVNALARGEHDPVKAKVLRAMGQVAAVPHVRWHALAASEYAIVVVNLMHPKDLARVKEQRQLQIAWMKKCDI